VATRRADGRAKRDERHRQVGSMRGNAVSADAEHGMHAVVAVEGRASGAGVALVALGDDTVSEIDAARALQKVAADGGHVADLRARRGEEGLGDEGKALAHQRVGGHLRHRGASRDAQPVRTGLDPAPDGVAEINEA
jgi:hypothetical protein